jgi:hypothetical protein
MGEGWGEKKPQKKKTTKKKVSKNNAQAMMNQ